MSRLSERLRVFIGAKEQSMLAQACILHLNIIVYAFSYWLTQPVLPFLSKDLGADPIQFGYLQTCFSVLQLVGGPLVGRVCDTKGSRLALLVSTMASAANNALLGSATNVPLLFASQIPTLFLHSMHAAQTAISLLSLPEVRAKSLGRLSLSYGVGRVGGSFLGGTLSQYIGYSGVAYLASFLSCIMMIITMIVLPEFRPEEEQSSSKEDSGRNRWADAKRILNRDLVSLLSMQLLVGSGLSVHQKSFSQALRVSFGLTAQNIGTMMSIDAVVSVVVNSFIVGPVTKHFSEATTLKVAMVVLICSFSAYSFASSLQALLVLVLPLSLGSTVLYTVFASRLSKCVEERDTGTSIGMSHAVRTFCGVFAPTLGGFLFQKMGFYALGMFSASCVALAFALSFVIDDRRTPKPKLTKKQK